MIDAILEIWCGVTGMLLFRLFGRKPPNDLTAILTGLLVWLAVAAGLFAVWRWH